MPGYTKVEPWKGHDRWACDDCPFDSIEEWRVEIHVARMHGPVVVETGLVDANGQPIVREQEGE